ncbi:hypothetical protein [Streptomyces gardneri]|uniref:hypothetical protein n=1 Tax=Streptomyces gardneri TaxID=66892 RepID=UPI0037D95C4C
MFEIQITCAHEDAPRVADALGGAFTLQVLHRTTTQDGARTRLHLIAHLPPATEEWPTPERAYANAPSITSEIGWTARAATDRPFGSAPSREFWLRKAAVLDRIALRGETGSDADDIADQAAQRLMDVDNATVNCDPRHYVRQQYARHTNP